MIVLRQQTRSPDRTFLDRFSAITARRSPSSRGRCPRICCLRMQEAERENTYREQAKYQLDGEIRTTTEARSSNNNCCATTIRCCYCPVYMHIHAIENEASGVRS